MSANDIQALAQRFPDAFAQRCPLGNAVRRRSGV
jgi:hypothetical protein